MATSVARKASLPAGVALVQAWTQTLPKLCAGKVEPPAVKQVPLPHETSTSQPVATTEAHVQRQQPTKSFKLHVGANLSIPTRNARDLPQMQPQPAARQQQQQGELDPFEGLPFRGFAERLGAAVMPTLKAAQEAERQAKLTARQAAAEAEVVMPEVPHVLPFTRWAASSQQFRSTFIADPPKDRKKARLSWYHPDDTMVPRDWFRGGLLEDLKYYSPFGLGSRGSKDAQQQQH